MTIPSIATTQDHKKSCHSREGGNPFSPDTGLANSRMDPRLRGDDKEGERIPSIFPWQVEQWNIATGMVERNRLPHALLLTGMSGLGKQQFSKAFSAFVLCQSKEMKKACGHCRSCVWLKAGFHPDEITISPLPESSIKIDSIRALVDTLHETSMQGGWRVIIIESAHALNLNAANALLKTLEEAPARTLFMLVTNQLQRLPATVRSRCQTVLFHKPKRSDALAWLSDHAASHDIELLLDLSDGAPLGALHLKENDLALRKKVYDGWLALRTSRGNPSTLAAEWQSQNVTDILNYFLVGLRDLLRLCVTAVTVEIVNKDYHADFLKTAKTLSKKDALHFLDAITDAHRALLIAPGLNKQLLLEDLLIRWGGYIHVSR